MIIYNNWIFRYALWNMVLCDFPFCTWDFKSIRKSQCRSSQIIKRSQMYINTDIYYRIEPHLIYLNNKKHQRALTRLRVSSHKLNIELGRHSRPPIPRANRLCNFCNSKEVDDEIHFLTKCEFHSEARYHMFDEIQRHQHVSQNLSPETYTNVWWHQRVIKC